LSDYCAFTFNAAVIGSNMSLVLLTCPGGTIVRPDKVLCDRQDGGHLIVNPQRVVWERSCLAPLELANWSLLVAATGRAMLEVLPALNDGCINYWEAGNWALNDQAAPTGPKAVAAHRRVHLHVFGRSRRALDPDWLWGESPRFPDFAGSERWAEKFTALSNSECEAVVKRVTRLLETCYRLPNPRGNAQA
jgi:diadenosine tetraphosphate (Ap4A) HIT family hydrolase